MFRKNWKTIKVDKPKIDNGFILHIDILCLFYR